MNIDQIKSLVDQEYPELLSEKRSGPSGWSFFYGSTKRGRNTTRIARVLQSHAGALVKFKPSVSARIAGKKTLNLSPLINADEIRTLLDAEISLWKQEAATEESSSITPKSKDKAVKNSVWLHDELILALDLYFKHSPSPAGKNSPEVLELSKFLQTMGRALKLGSSATYRNANGVYMKTMNFRRFDPSYIADGRVGLTKGNRDEQLVWNEFSNDHDRLSAVVFAIRSAIDKPAYSDDIASTDELDLQEAPEGKVLTRLHRTRERSPALVKSRKKQAMKIHGRLFCEGCGFDFGEQYGASNSNIVDCHHTKPVHTLANDSKTHVSDLVLLCANCHRVVHSNKPWLSLEKLKTLVVQIWNVPSKKQTTG